MRDPADGLGLANLTADMLTRGTARRSGPALDQAIEFVGGSLEADAGRDSATITLSVLKKDLALGLDLLAEVLRQPTFPADELTPQDRRHPGLPAPVRAEPGDGGRAGAGPADLSRAIPTASPRPAPSSRWAS